VVAGPSASSVGAGDRCLPLSSSTSTFLAGAFSRHRYVAGAAGGVLLRVEAALCLPPDGRQSRNPSTSRAPRSVPTHAADPARLLAGQACRQRQRGRAAGWGKPPRRTYGQQAAGEERDSALRGNQATFSVADIRGAVDEFLSDKWAPRSDRAVICVRARPGRHRDQDALEEAERMRGKGIVFEPLDSALRGEAFADD
jgi:hypothetical protein